MDGVTKIKCTQTGTDTDELGLSFFVHGSSAGTTVPSEAMSITHAGNVGIGTTDPSGPLHTWDTTIDQIHLTRAIDIRGSNGVAAEIHGGALVKYHTIHGRCRLVSL